MKGTVKMCSPRHHYFAVFLVLAISASCSQVLSEASSRPDSTSDHPHRHRHFHHRHNDDSSATSHGAVTSGDNDVTQALAALQVAVDLVQRNVIYPAGSGLTNSDDVTTESLAALETAVHKVQETFKHKSNGGGTASKLKSDDVRYDVASKLKSDDVRDDVKDDELSTRAATQDKTNRKPPYSENPSAISSQKADQTPQELESGRPGSIMQNLQSLPRIRQSNIDHDETKHKQNEEYYDYAVDAGDSNNDKDFLVDEAKPATENSTRSTHYEGQTKIDSLKNGTKSNHDKDRKIVSKIQTDDGVHAENSTTNNNQPSDTTTERTASLDNDDDEDTALEDFLSWFSWVRKPAKKAKLAQPELQKPEIKEETKKPVTDSVTRSSDKVEVKKKLEDDNKEDDSWDPATEDFHYDDLEYEENGEENGEEDGKKANSTKEEANSTRDLTEADHHASNLSTDAAKLSAEKLKSNETVETTAKGGKPKKSGNDTFGCVGCRKLSSSLAEAQELHRQVLRAQLLDKLQLVPAFKKRPWRPKLPDQVFPQRDRSDPAHDNYYAKPTSLLIFGRDLGPRHRLRKPATGSYQFGVTGKVKGSVTSADLWIYKMKDANDAHGQTLWVTEFHLIQEHKNTSASSKDLPRRSERHRLHDHNLVARLDTHVEEGWIRFDVTRLVRRWIKGKTPESHQLLAIRCKTCHRSKYRAIFGAKSHFRPVMVLQERMGNDDDGESDDDDDYKNDEDREGRHSRRKRSACDPNSTCCLFEMTVHFQDLGIHEIFHPRSIRANYCYGTCERPDLSYYNHTKITQHMRFGRTYAPYIDDALRDRLRPCCVPVVLSEASVMYYINDGLDTQVSNVPNLLVQRCGCA